MLRFSAAHLSPHQKVLLWGVFSENCECQCTYIDVKIVLRNSTGERRPGQMPLCSLVTFPITAFRGGVVSVQQKMDFIRGVTVMYYVLGMRQGWLGLPADIKCNGLSLHYVSIDPPKVQSVFMTSIHHWISFICITAKIDDMHALNFYYTDSIYD